MGSCMSSPDIDRRTKKTKHQKSVSKTATEHNDVDDPDGCCNCCFRLLCCCCPPSAPRQTDEIELEKVPVESTPYHDCAQYRAYQTYRHTQYTLSFYPTSQGHEETWHLWGPNNAEIVLTQDQYDLLAWVPSSQNWKNNSTGQISRSRPKKYSALYAYRRVPIRFDLIPISKRFLSDLGIHLSFVDGPIHDVVYGSDIKAIPPSLYSGLYYLPFLYNELSLYPKAFLRLTGLRRVILASKLAYDKQVRKAIPVVKSGTLYLDIDSEPIYFLQSVLHHELFHLFDDKMLMQLKYGLSSEECMNLSFLSSKQCKEQLTMHIRQYNLLPTQIPTLSTTTAATSPSVYSQTDPNHRSQHIHNDYEDDQDPLPPPFSLDASFDDLKALHADVPTTPTPIVPVQPREPSQGSGSHAVHETHQHGQIDPLMLFSIHCVMSYVLKFDTLLFTDNQQQHRYFHLPQYYSTMIHFFLTQFKLSPYVFRSFPIQIHATRYLSRIIRGYHTSIESPYHHHRQNMLDHHHTGAPSSAVTATHGKKRDYTGRTKGKRDGQDSFITYYNTPSRPLYTLPRMNQVELKNVFYMAFSPRSKAILEAFRDYHRNIRTNNGVFCGDSHITHLLNAPLSIVELFATSLACYSSMRLYSQYIRTDAYSDFLPGEFSSNYHEIHRKFKTVKAYLTRETELPTSHSNNNTHNNAHGTPPTTNTTNTNSNTNSNPNPNTKTHAGNDQKNDHTIDVVQKQLNNNSSHIFSSTPPSYVFQYPLLIFYQHLTWAKVLGNEGKRHGGDPSLLLNSPMPTSLRSESVGSDPLWLLLNPSNFYYGDGGHLHRQNTASIPFDKLTPYTNDDDGDNDNDNKKNNSNAREEKNGKQTSGDNAKQAQRLQQHRQQHFLKQRQMQAQHQHGQSSIGQEPTQNDGRLRDNLQHSDEHIITIDADFDLDLDDDDESDENDPNIKNTNNSNITEENDHHLSYSSSASTTTFPVHSPGFVNSYSMSAIEEDKAEVYAALIRHPPSILNSPDRYLRAKGLELWRRLELFCPEINQAFLDRLIMNKPHRIDPSDPHWSRQTHNGLQYWLNQPLSLQSWVDIRQYLLNMPRYPELTVDQLDEQVRLFQKQYQPPQQSDLHQQPRPHHHQQQHEIIDNRSTGLQTPGDQSDSSGSPQSPNAPSNDDPDYITIDIQHY